MQILEDLLPILFFFIAYHWKGIYFATLGMLLIFVGQLLLKKVRRQTISKLTWVNFFILICLGTMTLYFRNEWFIKWKPTILYWFMALGLIGYQRIRRESFLKKVLTVEPFIKLSAIDWLVLQRIWVIFLLGLGALNLSVAYYCSTKIWVSFKLFGTFGLLLGFLLLQGWWVVRKTDHKKFQD